MRVSYKLLISLLVLLVSVPILLVRHSMWDNDSVAVYFYTQDLFHLSSIWSHGWYTAYGLYWLLGEVFLLTGIYPRIFFSMLAVASIFGLTREVFIYLQKQFDLSRSASGFAALTVLAFPLWHLLMASCNAINLMFVWAFMAAVNLRHKRPWLAVGLLLFSLNFYSLYSLAVGIVCVECIMSVSRKNFVAASRKTVLFALAMMTLYWVVTRFVNVHGENDAYNVLDLNRIALALGCVAAAYAAAFLGRSVWQQFQQSGQQQDGWLFRCILSCVTLLFFAIFPYIAVGREISFFHFGSFGDRHAILTSIPIALLLGLCAEGWLRKKSLLPFHTFAGIILTAFIVLLYQGYDHKGAALLFKDMLVYSLKAVEPPPSGYVSLVEDGYKAPCHVHDYSVQVCFYRAYGAWRWLPNGFWARRGHEYSRQDLEARYPSDSIKGVMAQANPGNAFSKYRFKLKNFHQEGRFWYWYHLVFKDYTRFSPQLVRVE